MRRPSARSWEVWGLRLAVFFLWLAGCLALASASLSGSPGARMQGRPATAESDPLTAGVVPVIVIATAPGDPHQETPPPALSAADGAAQTGEASSAAATSEPAPTGSDQRYYRPAANSSNVPDPQPPRYSRDLGDVDIFGDGLGGPSWLDFGVDWRFRYEYRDNDLRQPVAVLDQPWFGRTRAYLGIRQRFDPLRGMVEFEDAWMAGSQFPATNREVNRNELIQAAAELYFPNGSGDDRPLRIQYGRLAMEYLDRRLVSRNEWRGTTNTFQGFRVIQGKQESDWQLDWLLLQPLERRLQQPDVVDPGRWFYGAVLDWRRWSQVATIQPYWFLLDQAPEGQQAGGRRIHTLGLRSYGSISGTGWDWDLGQILQFGRDGTRRHQAVAATAELGHRWEQHPWQPRGMVSLAYASGDRDPTDDRSQRFDRLFGFARPFSPSLYVTFDNVINLRSRLEWEAVAGRRMEVGYAANWLASPTDRWENAGLRDPTGQSGSFMGHELDFRIRLATRRRLDMAFGYAHFLPGEFTRNLGRGLGTDFFYVELSPRLLK